MSHRRRLKLVYLPASQLRRRFESGRVHPARQQRALDASIAEIGFVAPIIARKNETGEFEILDGESRAACAGDAIVPVLGIDAAEDDAVKIRLALDAVAGMALADKDRRHALYKNCPARTAEFRSLMRELAKKSRPRASRPARVDRSPTRCYLLVDCADEAAQRSAFEHLTSLNLSCRPLSL